MVISSLLDTAAVSKAPPGPWVSLLKPSPLFSRSKARFPYRPIRASIPIRVAPQSALKPSATTHSPPKETIYSYSYSIEQDFPKSWENQTLCLIKEALCLTAAAIVLATVSRFVSVFTEINAVAAEARINSGSGITVHKIQVGFVGMARTLRNDLNVITETAKRTPTKKRNAYVLTEIESTLLHHPGYCFYAYSSADVTGSRKYIDQQLEHFSENDFLNFVKEIEVKLIDLKNVKVNIQMPECVNNEYTVVTILLAVWGKLEVPADLKEALQMLHSLPSKKILGAEVYYKTQPQNANYILMEREPYDHPYFWLYLMVAGLFLN